MGKNFPQIMTLKDKPSCFEKTVQLIEKSFHYQPPNHFQTDFAPLIDESNHNNCFILIDENENVLAHIGAKEKFVELNGNKHSICLLGGIAVDEKNRGEGHFQSLMQEVLAEKRSDTATFLLWSDLEQLYRKFGFYLCGNQFEVDQAESIAGFSVTKYHSLTAAEKKNIQELYQSSFAQTYLSLERSDNDWNMIQKINSADLFIKKQADKITDYFFMNKGQDLPGVIYEYGSTRQLDHLIREAHHYGKVWMGLPLVETELLQFQYFMSPADLKLFTHFISDLTHNQIHIVNINVMKQEVFFNFNGETLALEVEEFLRGIFGPGTFEELGEIKPLFISGLDSI